MSDYIEEDVTRGEQRARTILFILVFVLFLAGFFYGTWWVWDFVTTSQHKTNCENNPRLLYAEECGTRQECLKKCARSLRGNG